MIFGGERAGKVTIAKFCVCLPDSRGSSVSVCLFVRIKLPWYVYSSEVVSDQEHRSRQYSDDFSLLLCTEGPLSLQLLQVLVKM